jgi:hypothetical protein
MNRPIQGVGINIDVLGASGDGEGDRQLVQKCG